MRVHDGINRVLTTEQLCEGLLTDLPAAGWELFHAILGGAAWSLASQRDARRAAMNVKNETPTPWS
ncbi:MAG: hypothetical protein QM811_14405 [Pirellulales bacterium]